MDIVSRHRENLRKILRMNIFEYFRCSSKYPSWNYIQNYKIRVIFKKKEVEKGNTYFRCKPWNVNKIWQSIFECSK